MSYLAKDIRPMFFVDPVFILIRVPERGFGDELDAMVQFFWEHGEEFRIGCFQSKPHGGDCALFRFLDPQNATEFARRFGGQKFVLPPDDDLSFP